MDSGAAAARCPIEKTLGMIGKKWVILILRDLLGGTRRFSDLLQSLNGISPKTLSERLKDLEEDGLITRKAYPEIPPRVEYSLTEKGRSLNKILEAMIDWGKKVN